MTYIEILNCIFINHDRAFMQACQRENFFYCYYFVTVANYALWMCLGPLPFALAYLKLFSSGPCKNRARRNFPSRLILFFSPNERIALDRAQSYLYPLTQLPTQKIEKSQYQIRLLAEQSRARALIPKGPEDILIRNSWRVSDWSQMKFEASFDQSSRSMSWLMSRQFVASSPTAVAQSQMTQGSEIAVLQKRSIQSSHYDMEGKEILYLFVFEKKNAFLLFD